jgi:hypothetical protein
MLGLMWLAALGTCLGAATVDEAEKADKGARFGTLEVFLDPKGKPMAAYQLKVSFLAGQATIVGIEGGGHPAFSEPPFYDPKAMRKEKVVLAAFSTLGPKKLPTSKVRVATLHLRIAGEPLKYTYELVTAANAKGKRIPAAVSFKERVAEAGEDDSQ